MKVSCWSGLVLSVCTTTHKRTTTQIRITQKMAVLTFEFIYPPARRETSSF